MTVEYLDAKRIQGQKGTNSDWTNGTGWTFGSNKHTVNNSTASVTRLTYYDLGSNQPDGWVLRFVLQATALASGGGWKFDIGLTEDATSSNMENENPTGTDTVYARADTGDWACLSTNGSSTLNYDQFNSYSLPYTIPSYYVEVRKLSSSQAQVKIWSDDWDGTLVSNSDVVSLSANPVCRYIFARFYYPSGATADNTVNVSNLKYYNSTTTSGTPTFETDFALDDKATLITPATSASEGWTLQSGVTISSGAMHLAMSGTTSNYGQKTIGSFDDDQLVLDFKLTRTSGDAGESKCVGLTSHTGGFEASMSDGDRSFRFGYGNGTSGNIVFSGKAKASGTIGYANYDSSSNTLATILPIGTTRYVRIIYGEVTGRFDIQVGTSVGDASVLDVNTNVFSANGTTSWSNADNLQYVVCQGSDNNASKNFSVDDIKYYSGEATPSGSPEFSDTFTEIAVSSDLPENTLFEETDTRKIYGLESGVWNQWYPLPWTYGISFGGTGNQDLMNKVTIDTTGNASNIGNMVTDYNERGYGTSDRTRALIQGGCSQSQIDYTTIATASTTADFGDLSVARGESGAVSDMTKAAFAGGDGNCGGQYKNEIDYVTIQTTGNAADFGDLTTTKAYVAGASDFFGTSGKGWIYMVGSYNSSSGINVITVGTPANASSYGSLYQTGAGASSNESDSRVVAKTNGYSNDIQYFSIPTYGTAATFGDVTVARGYSTGGFTNKTRAVFHGGNLPSGAGRSNVMDYVTIATTGNATDFGDLSDVVYACASASGT